MILYITRKFPPSIGGMQRFNFKLAYHLRKKNIKIHLVAWGGNQIFLPIFILYSFFCSLLICLFNKIECIYLSDGLLSPLGVLLKTITHKKTVATIHGRDIAFDLKPYQRTIQWALKKTDKISCVSSALKEECIKRGVPASKITVIPNGVDIEDFHGTNINNKNIINQITGRNLNEYKILITVGRLVKKKGVDSFLKNIFPKILKQYDKVAYLIVGDGPLKEEITTLINQNKLQDNVFLTGQLSMDSGQLINIYNTADIFVMPNVPVNDDMEGFGIVAIEAGAAGIPVVASRVDGIAQAIVDDENGFLCDYNNYDQFANIVLRLLNNDEHRKLFGQKAKRYVENHYSWKHIAGQYANLFLK